MYNNEIIQFFGGINQYIGELDQSDHPLGAGWWRINNPCCPYTDQEGDKIKVSLTRIWGIDKLYRKFVDIYCPPDSLIEIRVVDKNGGLYKAYINELGRPDLSLIHSPYDTGR